MRKCPFYTLYRNIVFPTYLKTPWTREAAGRSHQINPITPQKRPIPVYQVLHYPKTKSQKQTTTQRISTQYINTITQFPNYDEENLCIQKPPKTPKKRPDAEKLKCLFKSTLITTNTNKMTENTPQTTTSKRPRAPPSCGYCHTPGHTIRGCNDPTMLNHRRVIEQKITNREPIPNLVAYLNDMDFPLRKLVLAKNQYGKCTNLIPQHSDDPQLLETQFIRRTQSVYDYKEQQLRRDLLVILSVMISRIYYTLDTQYTQYFSQLEENPAMPLAIEYENFRTLIRVRTYETQHFTQYIDYNTVLRWHNFMHHCRRTMIAATTVPPRQPATTYHFVASTVRNSRFHSKFHETIECPICLTEVSTPEVSQVDCGHKFCKTCIRSTIRACPSYKRCGCPMCRAPIHKIVRKIPASEPAIIDLTAPEPMTATA
jgi:hypothetical protein